MTTELSEWTPFVEAPRSEARPIRRIAVAVQPTDGDDFVFHAVDGDDPTLNWSGTTQATTADSALLDVFVHLRLDVHPLDRIRFLVKVPRRSLIWAHVDELRSALPRCTFQGPGPGDAEVMMAAVAGLPPEPAPSAVPSVEELSLPALTVAADGSVRGRFCGYGWLASDGQYGLQGRVDSRKLIGRRASMVAELRAIDEAVRRLAGRHLTVYCDNSYAVSMARKWMDGQEILPEGYSTERAAGKQAGLVVAQRRLHRNPARLDIRWAPGHRGEPLNEGADALARLASRYVKGDSGLTPGEYRERAQGLADAFAAAFRRTERSAEQTAERVEIYALSC